MEMRIKYHAYNYVSYRLYCFNIRKKYSRFDCYRLHGFLGLNFAKQRVTLHM